jgi:acyl-CoA thioester hydrolase
VRLSLEPSRQPADYSFVHRIRTRFSETDAMGVIHHAAYLLYLEQTRVEFLRQLGHSYIEERQSGHDLAVLEASVQYRRPLHFDDEVEVHLHTGAITRTTFQLAYLLTVGGEVRATAVTVHGCIHSSGKATRLPAWVAQELAEG